MQLTGTRFGEIEVDATKVIALRSGLIGFPSETKFVLLRPGARKQIAWLQSLQSPALAFPVIESRQVSPPYPAETMEALAEQAGIRSGAVSILVIVAVRPRAPRVVANLLAPVVIDCSNGNGAQIVLNAKKYSASTPLASMAAPSDSEK
jgi:flagellar assembly factor FliW